LSLKNHLGYYCYRTTNYLVQIHSLKLRKSTTALSTGFFLVLLLLLSIPANILELNDHAWATPTEIPVYMLTTRGDREQAEGVEELGYNDKYSLRDINELYTDCPEETAIFVHGWGNDHYKAKERLDRVKMSLENNSYYIPLVGLSWDSNTTWDQAKLVAKENGPKLGQFILEYKETCKHEQNIDVKVRLLGHSMGSRVILSALQHLYENPVWNNNTNNFKIASVHLMGAAVDNEEVSTNSINHFNYPAWGYGPIGCYPSHYYTGDGVKFPYGNAIAGEVVKFYNLINPQDNVLEYIYPCFEGGDGALGEDGKQKSGISPPPDSIYFEEDIQDEIKSFRDADAMEGWDFGLCNIFGSCLVNIGDNHAGYIGFRNPTNPNLLADDGAMNIVVEQWQSDG
jgi:pimeloyl-ACP methyl ester carboxylesterase